MRGGFALTFPSARRSRLRKEEKSQKKKKCWSELSLPKRSQPARQGLHAHARALFAGDDYSLTKSAALANRRKKKQKTKTKKRVATASELVPLCVADGRRGWLHGISASVALLVPTTCCHLYSAVRERERETSGDPARVSSSSPTSFFDTITLACHSASTFCRITQAQQQLATAATAKA